MPPGLKTMFQEMDSIVDCTAFIPAYLKVPMPFYTTPSRSSHANLGPLQEALSKLVKDDPYFKAPANHMYENDNAVVPNPNRGCHTPEAFVHHLRSVVELSGECQDTRQVESGWNLLVHTPVLAAGLYFGPLRKDRVCLVPWYALSTIPRPATAMHVH
ncbi:methyltransferase type 11 [Colletotrichum tofieldiae]|nr:methyltransferase type 11 [Colletotrichum tofieldiae]